MWNSTIRQTNPLGGQPKTQELHKHAEVCTPLK